MAELFTLTTPETKPSNAKYAIERVTLDWKAGTIHIQLLGQNDEAISKVYSAQTVPTGTSLMIALNKANLSVKSLQKRIFEQLELDGVFAGSITGTPD